MRRGQSRYMRWLPQLEFCMTFGLSGATPGLNKASLDGVQQWRYEPFTCQGKPVEVDTVVFVNYTLNF